MAGQFKIYRSTDASAPVLSGQVGALTALLTACLNTGYGSQTNAGWTVPFTGTNGAVYKQGGGNGFYMLINDNGPGAGAAIEARIFPSEACTAYDAAAASSTNRFPTSAQAANGQFIRKSATASATARPWIVAADNKTMYMFIQTGDTASTYYGWGFGDFFSYLTGDTFNTMVTARSTENSNVATADGLDQITAGLNTGRAASYYARAYTGTGGSINFGVVSAKLTSSSTTIAGSNSLGYPNQPDGAVYASKFFVGDQQTSINLRGELRGLWGLDHANTNVIDGDTFTATSGTLSGKTFLVIKQSANSGLYLLETSNTLP